MENDQNKGGNLIKSTESPNKKNYKSIEIKPKIFLGEEPGYLGVENISKVLNFQKYLLIKLRKI
jgi:hypothetical protein